MLHSMVSGTQFLSLELQPTEAIKWISEFDLGFTPGMHTHTQEVPAEAAAE